MYSPMYERLQTIQDQAAAAAARPLFGAALKAVFALRLTWFHLHCFNDTYWLIFWAL